jgi:hypothetical protein
VEPAWPRRVSKQWVPREYKLANLEEVERGGAGLALNGMEARVPREYKLANIEEVES